MTASPTQSAPTVFIVDDHEQVLDSLKWLIGMTGLPVETFASPSRFFEERHWERAGCLILDIQMEEMNGLELQRRLKDVESCMPIIAMTAHANVAMAVGALTNGALYFLEKPFGDKKILDLIDEAMRRNQILRREKSRADQVTSRLERLTPRERAVLDLVVSGKQNKEIARHLNLSEKTIEVHRGHMMSKMQASNLADLIHTVHGLLGKQSQ